MDLTLLKCSGCGLRFAVDADVAEDEEALDCPKCGQEVDTDRDRADVR